MKESLYVNPLTGGYVIENNTLVKKKSVINKVNLLLKQQIGKNIYDLTNGNPLIDKQGILSASEIAADLNICLRPLLETGEIKNLNVLKIEISQTLKYKIYILLTLPDGTTETIDWKR